MTQAYVLGAKRTPIGSFQGALSTSTAPELGAHAIRAAIEHAGVDAHAIDEVFMGNVVSAGVRQAPARQAMREAGLPDACGATTVNKVCGSGMKAAMLATDLIRAGSAECVVAGGMESMTNAPYLVQKARAGLRMGHRELADSMFTDGLEDAETGGSMGSFAQDTADEHQLTRAAMDDFAIQSVTKALAAMDDGALDAEISPFGDVTEDEQPRRSKIDRIPGLRPAFKKDGTITAANASSISDGASALIIGGENAAAGAKPLARIVAHATHSIHPLGLHGRTGRGDRQGSRQGRLVARRRRRLRNQRGVRLRADDGHRRTRPRRRQGESLRRRLRPGPSHRLNRGAPHRHLDARPRGHRRQARRRLAVHRRGGEATAIALERL